MEPGGEILPQSRVHPRPAFIDRTPGAGVFPGHTEAQPPTDDQEEILPSETPEPELEKSHENLLSRALWFSLLPVVMLVLASLQLDLLFFWTRPSKASKLAKALFQCLCILGLAVVLLGHNQSWSKLSWQADYLATKVENMHQDSLSPSDRHFLESFSHFSKDTIKLLIKDFYDQNQKARQEQVNPWVQEALPAHAKSDAALIQFIKDLNQPLSRQEASDIALAAFQKVQLGESELSSLLDEARKAGKFDFQVSSHQILSLLAENPRVQNVLSPESINQILANQLKQAYSDEAIKAIGEELLQKNKQMITDALNLTNEQLSAIIQKQIAEWMAHSPDPLINTTTFQQFVEEAKAKLQTQQQERDHTIQSLNQQVQDQIQNLTELGSRFDNLFSQTESLTDGVQSLKRALDQLQQQITKKDLVLTPQQVQQMVTETTERAIKSHGFQPAVDMKQVAAQIAAVIDTYSADKIGLPDYAVASVGGSIVFASSKIPLNKDTQLLFSNNPTLYETKVPQMYLEELNKQIQSTDLQSDQPNQIDVSKGSRWFGKTNPQTTAALNMISPSLSPGDCWAFPGTRGQAMIKLSCPVAVTHVSIDHAHIKTLINGGGSTPNQFEVKGWETDSNGQLINPQSLLTASYIKGAEQIQTFEVKNPSGKIFNYVSLELYSNYGASFTCIYRFRVHSSKGSCQTA